MTGLLFVAALLAVEETSTIERSFPGAKRIEVDNIHGSIRVTGYSGPDIRVKALRSVTADTKELIAKANQDVTLDLSRSGDAQRVYVEGPFRCNCEDGSGSWRWRGRDRDYTVRYDFEIQVPRDTFLALRTVNDGEIRVEGVDGGYDVDNVNGGIEMMNVSGSGRAYALNRPLKVTFRRNPREASSFGSLNGEVHLYFQPDLAADFRIKTFNGKVYSDFPMTSLAARPPVHEKREGRTLYKADKFSGARVGRGGPEIKLNGFNGDMHILSRIQETK